MKKEANQYIYEIVLEFNPIKPGYEDILVELLVDQGIVLSEIVQSQRNKKNYLSVYMKDSYQSQRIKTNLDKYQLKNVKILRKRLVNKDWQTKWHKDFKPLWLTKKIRVVPAWYMNNPRYQKESSLFIDTSVAFGTGMHPTTRFTAQLVEQRSDKIRSFLDLGTGTGILTILAHKCGATELGAVDISKDAIKIARLNFSMNNCKPDMIKAIDLRHLKIKKKYDFVAANLVTDDLIKMSRKIVGFVAPQGYLGLSGVSLNNFDLVKSHFKKYPLRCLRVLKGEGWTAILFKKIK